MQIQAIKLLERNPNGIVGEVFSFPEFDIPQDFIENLFSIHLSEGKGKPNFQKVEGDSLILSFFSGGKDVFMILPNYVMLIIPEGESDEKEYVRICRVLINNFLLHVEDLDFETYVANTLEKINSEGIKAIKIEKKEIAEPPKAEPTAVPEEKQEKPGEKANFSDIEELVVEMKVDTIEDEATKADPFGAAKDPFGTSPPSKVKASNDPFAGSSGGADPFGGSTGGADPFGSSTGGADPFGGSAADSTDPFGASSGSSSFFGAASKENDPFSSNFPSDDKSDNEDSLFKSSNEDEAFADNPWEKKETKKKDGPDPFAENPW
jgi:hypothetical protein